MEGNTTSLVDTAYNARFGVVTTEEFEFSLINIADINSASKKYSYQLYTLVMYSEYMVSCFHDTKSPCSTLPKIVGTMNPCCLYPPCRCDTPVRPENRPMLFSSNHACDDHAPTTGAPAVTSGCPMSGCQGQTCDNRRDSGRKHQGSRLNHLWDHFVSFPCRES